MAKFGNNELVERLKQKTNVDSSRPEDTVVEVTEKEINNSKPEKKEVKTVAKSNSDELKSNKIGFWVSIDLKKRIDIFCVENDVKLQELVEESVALLLKNGVKAMAKQTIDTSEDKQVFCRVTNEEKKQLKLFCIANGVSIKEAMTKAIMKKINYL